MLGCWTHVDQSISEALHSLMYCNTMCYNQGRFMTFWGPQANDIMAPSDGATLYLARTRLEYFLLVIYFSDIYIAFQGPKFERPQAAVYTRQQNNPVLIITSFESTMIAALVSCITYRSSYEHFITHTCIMTYNNDLMSFNIITRGLLTPHILSVNSVFIRVLNRRICPLD